MKYKLISERVITLYGQRNKKYKNDQHYTLYNYLKRYIWMKDDLSVVNTYYFWFSRANFFTGIIEDFFIQLSHKKNFDGEKNNSIFFFSNLS